MRSTTDRVLWAVATVFLGGLIATAPRAARAGSIASEFFNYPDGALAGNNGGTGWSGAWTGNGTVSGGTATLGGAAFRGIGSSIVPATGTDLYVSFNFSDSSIQTTHGSFAGLSFYDGSNERFFLGVNFDGAAYGLNSTGIANVNSSVNATGSTDFLLGHFHFNSATNVTADLYVNPGETLGTPTATYTGGIQAGSWDTIRLTGESSITTYADLQIGTTLTDVTALPVPSAAWGGLVLISGLGLWQLRRQRA